MVKYVRVCHYCGTSVIGPSVRTKTYYCPGCKVDYQKDATELRVVG